VPRYALSAPRVPDLEAFLVEEATPHDEGSYLGEDRKAFRYLLTRKIQRCHEDNKSGM
jgi:hypothetical protein